MRPEPDRPSPFPPSSGDHPLAEGTFFGRRFPVRMKVHTSTEIFSEPATINWFHLSEGIRTLTTMRAYITLPTPPPAPTPSGDPELDALFHDGASQTRTEPVANGSAWYYPAVQGLLLWDIYLSPVHRTIDPLTDPNLPALWLGFEAALLERFPDTHFLVTPSWDPSHDQDTWDRFLFSLGYAPHVTEEQLFIKLIEPS